MTVRNEADELNQRFLKALEDIKDSLSEKYDTPYKGVGAAVNNAREHGNMVVKQNYKLLKYLADLRNILVHSPTGEPVATPRQAAVAALEELAEQIQNPIQVHKLMVKNPVILAPGTPLADVLTQVIENDLSQIPICNESTYVGLLTTNMIARWLSDSITRHGGVVVDGEVTAGDVLGFAEALDCATFLGVSAAASTACRKLSTDQSPAAVLITDDGKLSGKIRGILTSADVPRILKHIRVTLDD